MKETRKRANSDSQQKFKRRKPQLLQHKSSNPINEDGTSECFHKITTSLYVSLAPSYLKQPLEGIKSQHLDPMLMKHFHPAGGVVIGYDNLRLSAEHINNDNSTVVAKVNAHSPFAFLWISVDLLLWKPQVGDVLEGHIYMQSPSHIGLLINDTFNASIKKNNIPEGWSFVPNQADEVQDVDDDDENTHKKSLQSLGQWYDESEIAVDGKLKFTVKAIHNSGRVVSVEGSLIKPGSESETKPVMPNKKIKFEDTDISAIVVVDEEEETEKISGDIIPTYQANSDDEVVAQDDSSDDDDDSDSD